MSAAAKRTAALPDLHFFYLSRAGLWQTNSYKAR